MKYSFEDELNQYLSSDLFGERHLDKNKYKKYKKYSKN
jgi:hypothetical protein